MNLQQTYSNHWWPWLSSSARLLSYSIWVRRKTIYSWHWKQNTSLKQLISLVLSHNPGGSKIKHDWIKVSHVYIKKLQVTITYNYRLPLLVTQINRLVWWSKSSVKSTTLNAAGRLLGQLESLVIGGYEAEDKQLCCRCYWRGLRRLLLIKRLWCLRVISHNNHPVRCWNRLIIQWEVSWIIQLPTCCEVSGIYHNSLCASLFSRCYAN